ncbi:hypothetical protein BBK82_41185 [Lentzea guizhouensis]|uniref:Lipoprotein n=1 Tax=Lentzea guizhouensis TaxID=1586287 RepID=A0A1B2HUQ4_9PSEU|nr:hypothetical protein [Lentzea guizhouensis]ANZ41428.1 hypothetical protein BBK82_41185 [Lentzea guizhouensis]
MRVPALLLCSATVLIACTGSPDPGPVFDNENGSELTCLRHQPQPPGPRYTDEALRRTDHTLPLLRYYTAHGRKPFCDDQTPTDIDKQWAQLYVDLGADRANVSALLD